MPNIEELKFLINNKEEKSFPSDHILFSLSGSPKIVWSVDEDKLKTDLLNISKKQFAGILKKNPKIEKADASVWPFWKTNFPNKKKNIDIVSSM